MKPLQLVKSSLRFLLGGVMVFAGITHFTSPEPFIRIVPAALPAPAALVAVSGVFEILGGVGLILPIPRLRRAAAWGLIALYIAVFPANVNMAINNISMTDSPVSPLVLWIRLPLQAVLIGLAYWFTRPDELGRTEPTSAPPRQPS